MPVGAVRRSRRLNGGYQLLQLVAALRVPEADRAATEVDFESHVVPNVGLPLRLPLGVLRDHELQVGVLGALLTGDPAVLQLGKVAFEEADLVLAVLRRGIGILAEYAEVVKHFAAVDSSLSLGDQLDASHVLSIPEGGRVQCKLGSLLRYRVRRVLEVGREVDVLFDRARSVDVVLVRSDLVTPRPFVQVG